MGRRFDEFSEVLGPGTRRPSRRMEALQPAREGWPPSSTVDGMGSMASRSLDPQVCNRLMAAFRGWSTAHDAGANGMQRGGLHGRLHRHEQHTELPRTAVPSGWCCQPGWDATGGLDRDRAADAARRPDNVEGLL